MAAISPLPACIHLAGADGSGKTTQARALADWLRGNGGRVRLAWLRFPRLLCTPLLAYARLRGYSWQEESHGSRFGYWRFRQSWLMREVFPWLLWVDTLLTAVPKIYLPAFRGQRVICDRFVADLLVDLMLGLEDPQFDRSLPGRLYLALLPPGTRVVVIDLETETAVLRNGGLAGDRTREARRQLYLGLAARQGWSILPGDADPQAVTDRLIAVLTGEPSWLPPERTAELAPDRGPDATGSPVHQSAWEPGETSARWPDAQVCCDAEPAAKRVSR